MSQPDRSAPPPYGRFAMGPVRGDRLPPAPYQVLRDEPGALEFVTAPARRWAQARLHAAGALVPALAALFPLPFVWERLPVWLTLERLLAGGAALFATLLVAGFLLGRRARVQVRAGDGVLERARVPALGPADVARVKLAEVRGFEYRGLLRTLGADLELVAVTTSGEVVLCEGDPHTGQMRALAEKLAALAGVEARLGEPR